jgi:hypothetical protein
MPVILTPPAEADTRLSAPAKEALALQRPLPDGSLKIVARGDRTADISPELALCRRTAANEKTPREGRLKRGVRWRARAGGK